MHWERFKFCLCLVFDWHLIWNSNFCLFFHLNLYFSASEQERNCWKHGYFYIKKFLFLIIQNQGHWLTFVFFHFSKCKQFSVRMLIGFGAATRIQRQWRLHGKRSTNMQGMNSLILISLYSTFWHIVSTFTTWGRLLFYKFRLGQRRPIHIISFIHDSIKLWYLVLLTSDVNFS